MHNILGGQAGVERSGRVLDETDFVEAPSQMLEEFSTIGDPAVVRSTTRRMNCCRWS